MYTIKFSVEENDETVEGGSTSASAKTIEEIKEQIEHVMGDLEKAVDAKFERNLVRGRARDTFVLDESDGDKRLICKVVGLTEEDRIEIESILGDF